MVYFRFPFSEKIWTTDESSAKIAVSFISFDGLKEIDFRGEIIEISREEFLSQKKLHAEVSSRLCIFREETKKDYVQKIDKVIDFVKNEKLAKLVISRRKMVNFQGSKPNLSKTFLNLCETYPNAFVYLFIKDGKCWIGAFSEVLGKLDKKTSQFETMSLAGTIPLNEDWSSKELEEQQPVTEYIRAVLENYTAEIEQSKTYDHPSGNIKHLRTDFKAIIDKEDFEKVISDLHPTPAVCGFPKDFCKNAISKFEKDARNFYAGYIKVETENNIQCFVNLRCAEILRNAAFIYVGGGITADSSPAKEWQETELKAEAILKNIVFNKS